MAATTREQLIIAGFTGGYVGVISKGGTAQYWIDEETARREAVEYYPAWVPRGAVVRVQGGEVTL